MVKIANNKLSKSKPLSCFEVFGKLWETNLKLSQSLKNKLECFTEKYIYILEVHFDATDSMAVLCSISLIVPIGALVAMVHHSDYQSSRQCHFSRV